MTSSPASSLDKSFTEFPCRVRVTAAEGLREAVLAGLGLAIASEWIFTPELASGAVRPVMDDWLLPSQDLWAVFPSGRLVSSKARTFALFMKTYMADFRTATLCKAQ